MSPAEKMASEKKKRTKQAPDRIARSQVCCSIRKKREALGLSSSNVAAGVGIAASHAQWVERGAGVGVVTALKLARFFGCPVEELWQLVEDKP